MYCLEMTVQNLKLLFLQKLLFDQLLTCNTDAKTANISVDAVKCCLSVIVSCPNVHFAEDNVTQTRDTTLVSSH